jgi:hypothetical protein
MNGTATPLRITENPVKMIRRRNLKIQRLIYAVFCALVAAVLLLFAPEIGVGTAVIASLVAGGSSAAFTLAAKHTHL